MTQNWFTKFCRNTGLMIHHATKPMKPEGEKKIVNQTTEEKQVNDKMILRRTTIDEVEIRK